MMAKNHAKSIGVQKLNSRAYILVKPTLFFMHPIFLQIVYNILRNWNSY